MSRLRLLWLSLFIKGRKLYKKNNMIFVLMKNKIIINKCIQLHILEKTNFILYHIIVIDVCIILIYNNINHVSNILSQKLKSNILEK